MNPLAAVVVVLLVMGCVGMVWLMWCAERAPQDPDDPEVTNWDFRILEDGHIQWYRVRDDDPA